MQDLARYFVNVVKFERRLRSSLIALPHFMPSWALRGLVTLSWPDSWHRRQDHAYVCTLLCTQNSFCCLPFVNYTRMGLTVGRTVQP